MRPPQFWLIAGPNGAGKTTLAKSAALSNLTLPQPYNPDNIAFALLRKQGFQGFHDAPFAAQRECSITAAEWVYAEICSGLKSNQAVSVETVLSTTKYLELFKDTAEGGGDACLIYVGNHDPAISVERVSIRVSKGGHDVPISKIEQRWHRSLRLMPVFWNVATQAWLFDHSEADAPPRWLAYKNPHDGQTTEFPTDDSSVLLDALHGTFPLQES